MIGPLRTLNLCPRWFSLHEALRVRRSKHALFSLSPSAVSFTPSAVDQSQTDLDCRTDLNQASMSPDAFVIAVLLNAMEQDASIFLSEVFTFCHEDFKHHDTGHNCHVSWRLELTRGQIYFRMVSTENAAILLGVVCVFKTISAPGWVLV